MLGTVAIDSDELLAALNDPAVAEKVMTERGWTTEDLMAQAEELNRTLIESMSAINIV